MFAGTPAGRRILHEQTLPPVWAVITTWLTNTGQRDRQRWGGREGETDYHSVQLPPIRKATLRSALAFSSHSLTSCTACDSWVVLHTGNRGAGKHPSSKITLPTPPKHSFNDWTAHKCPVCVRHAVSKALVQFMQHIRSMTAHFSLSLLQMVNSWQRRLKGLLGAPLRKISFYWVKTEDYISHRETLDSEHRLKMARWWLRHNS